MPMSPGSILNPHPTSLFCPDQTDFLTFRSSDGFGAVYLDLVEAITALKGSPGSAVQLTTQVWYESTESVPELVARFAAVKKLRYTPERKQDELQGQGNTTRPIPSTVDGQAPPSSQSAAPNSGLPARPGIWTKPGGQQ